MPSVPIPKLSESRKFRLTSTRYFFEQTSPQKSDDFLPLSTWRGAVEPKRSGAKRGEVIQSVIY